MPKPFHLFRLPRVARARVLKYFGTVELIHISLFSNLALQSSKSVLKKPRKLLIFIDGKFEIWLQFRRSQLIWTFIDDAEILSENGGAFRVTKWSGWGCKVLEESYERKFGFRQIIDRFLDVFEIPVFVMTVSDFIGKFDVGTLRVLFENLKVENLRLGYLIPPSHVNLLLEPQNLKISKKLVLKSTPSTPEDLSFGMEELQIEHSDWLELGQLLRIRCKSVDLGFTSLTSNNWNLYLKFWKSAALTDIRELKARSEDGWNVEKLLHGLDAREVAPNTWEIIKTTLPCKSTTGTIFLRTFDIQSVFVFSVTL